MKIKVYLVITILIKMKNNFVKKISKTLETILYYPKKFIPLHEPTFFLNEKRYLDNCIKEGFVSTAGRFVNEFEKKVKELTKSKHAVAVVNGTAAIQIALKLVGVKKDDEVLVPGITFIGSVNAILYNNATPHFVDSEIDSFGVNEEKLRSYLKKNSVIKNKICYNKNTKKIIRALIVVHVFGHAAEISKLKKLSKDFHIPIVEDAAEAIGSYYNNKHLGTFGEMGVISFNGNKTITTGGGGILLTNNKTLALKAKHLTTTAKIPHTWEYIFKETGYNFRMPNINAALGLAQIKKLKIILSNKKRVYKIYKDYFSQIEGVNLMSQPKKCNSNFWLQTLILDKNFSKYKRLILKETNKKNVGTRPCWKPLHKLKHLQNFPRMNMSIANEIYKRIINIPSSSHLKMKKK